MKYIILLSLFISFSTIASGRLSGSEVSSIKIGIKGNIIASFVSEHENPDNCGNNRSFYITESHAGKELMLSLLLSSKATGDKITVFVSGCSSSSNANDQYPLVHSMDIL